MISLLQNIKRNHSFFNLLLNKINEEIISHEETDF